MACAAWAEASDEYAEWILNWESMSGLVYMYRMGSPSFALVLIHELNA